MPLDKPTQTDSPEQKKSMNPAFTGWRRRYAYVPNKAAGWIAYSFLIPIIAIAIEFLTIIPSIPLVEAFQARGLMDADDNPTGAVGMIAFLALYFPMWGAVYLSYIGIVERRSWASFGLSLEHGFRRFVRGWFVGAVMICALMVLLVPAGGYELETWSPAVFELSSLPLIVGIVLATAIQSATEEFVFRGWMLSAVTIRRGIWVGIGVSSLLFWLAHSPWTMTPIMHVNVFLFAFFLAFYALREGGIIGACAIHGGWNALVAIGFGTSLGGMDAQTPALIAKMNPVGEAWLTGGDYGPEASVAATVVLAVACLIMLIVKANGAPWSKGET